MKKCLTCNEEKSIELFGIHSKGKRRNQCKRCLAAKNRQISKGDSHLGWDIRKALNQYPASDRDKILHDLRRNTCEACGQSNVNSSRRLQIDHDHLTGAYRGVLCISCNVILGHAKDDPQRLLELRDYLLRRTPGLKP